MPQATPKPRLLGPFAGVQPNLSAAAFKTRIMRGSLKLFRRNSTGSTPAPAAMMSICDSRANVLVLLPGARHAPVADGCALAGPPKPEPRDAVRWFGTV